jgi:hypothetical protein
MKLQRKSKETPIRTGLKFCSSLKFSSNVDQLDSQVLMNQLNCCVSMPWVYYDIYRHKDEFQQSFGSYVFMHVYREGNLVAKVLANLACSILHCVSFDSSTSLLEEARGLCNLYRLQVPSQRVKHKSPR